MNSIKNTGDVTSVDCPHWFEVLTDEACAWMPPTTLVDIAYGGDSQYHASYANGAWQVETASLSLQVGQHAALDFDANSYPHISYYDAANGALKYATRTLPGWRVETVHVGLYPYVPTSMRAPRKHPHMQEDQNLEVVSKSNRIRNGLSSLVPDRPKAGGCNMIQRTRTPNRTRRLRTVCMVLVLTALGLAPSEIGPDIFDEGSRLLASAPALAAQPEAPEDHPWQPNQSLYPYLTTCTDQTSPDTAVDAAQVLYAVWAEFAQRWIRCLLCLPAPGWRVECERAGKRRARHG